MSLTGFTPIQFSYSLFWQVLTYQSPYNPKYCELVRLTESTLLCENPPDNELLDNLSKIYSGEFGFIHRNLPSLELLFLMQIRAGCGLNKEIEINGQTYKIVDLYEHLNLVIQRLVAIMTKIAKKYSLEIPMQAFGSYSNTNLGN